MTVVLLSPDAAQHAALAGRDALLIRGPRFATLVLVGPGSAEQREERCTASGTRAKLANRRAAVDDNGLTRHERAGARGQKHRGAGDLVGLADTQ